MLQDSWEADVRVVVRVYWLLAEERARDGVNQDRCCLVEFKFAVDASLGNAVRCVQVDVQHACHVDVQLFCEQVLKVCENLHIAYLLRLDARHDYVQANVLELAAAIHELLLHRDGWNACLPRALHLLDLLDSGVHLTLAI